MATTSGFAMGQWVESWLAHDLMAEERLRQRIADLDQAISSQSRLLQRLRAAGAQVDTAEQFLEALLLSRSVVQERSEILCGPAPSGRNPRSAQYPPHRQWAELG